MKMVSTADTINDYDDKMVEAFVNKPEVTSWYINAFSRFSVNGVNKMSWVWSWWAFFGGIFYLLYRKAYMAALGLLALSIVSFAIPFGGLIVWILTGGLAPYFVYKTYQTKKAEIEANIADEHVRIETMRAVGGYNNWAVLLAVAFHAFMWIWVFFAFSTMMAMLPQQ
jgi:hypothetical protein